MSLPSGFWWGAGASATALEGAASGSDRRDWEDRGLLAPSGDGTGFAAAPRDDVRLLVDHGLSHLRYVLDWARIEPAPGRIDDAAVEQARDVLTGAAEAGAAVWGCLHDGALPGWFAVDEHGFGDARSRGYFWARHVELVGEAFGDLVHGWVPTFEPNRWALRGWIDGDRPPGRKDDAEGFAEALEGVLLATVDAARRLRGAGQPVASAHWHAPVFPARLQHDAPPSADAQVMARVVDAALRGCWVRLVEEEVLEVPGRSPVPVPGAREAFDVLGLTYRHAIAVRGDGVLLPYPQALPTGADGQVPWTEGLELVLHQLAEDRPGRRLLVAGVGLATTDEAQREEHLRALLAIAEDAVAGGIPLEGLWWTTPIDPTAAATPPGLFDRDRDPRPAARLLARVAGGEPVPR